MKYETLLVLHVAFACFILNHVLPQTVSPFVFVFFFYTVSDLILSGGSFMSCFHVLLFC